MRAPGGRGIENACLLKPVGLPAGRWLAATLALLAGCSGGGCPKGKTCSSADQAQAPLDLSVVDLARPRRVFVTTGKYGGDLMSAGGGTDGPDGADRLCGLVADQASLGGRWKAWITSGTVNAFDRLDDAAPWYLVDGSVVVFAYRGDLTSGPAVPIMTTETGAKLAPTEGVWTGEAGWMGKSTCLDWTSAAPSENGSVGQIGDPAKWINRENWTEPDENCSRKWHLYCFEQ